MFVTSFIYHVLSVIHIVVPFDCIGFFSTDCFAIYEIHLAAVLYMRQSE